MAITVEVDGKQYFGFKTTSAEITLDTMSGQFSLNQATLGSEISPFKVGQECVIRVEDEQVITGFIEAIEVNYDAEDHSITLSGRDKTSDVIDSSTDKNIEFQSDLSLKENILQTLEKNNITGIDVVDNVGDIPAFTRQEIESESIGEQIGDFLQSMAAKKQVFLTTDGMGNIVISRSQGALVDEALVSDPENPSSNILKATVRYNDSDRFNTYTVFSQENNAAATSFGGIFSGENITNRKGLATDSDIRTSRNIAIQADRAYTATQLQERSQWEANIRRVRSEVYTCTVRGHKRSDNSGIWKPDQKVQIKDVFAGIEKNMLINRVVYTQSNEGTFSELSFVTEDAYKVEAELPIALKEQDSSNPFLLQ
jgi:prophage tail gpP-like protein